MCSKPLSGIWLLSGATESVGGLVMFMVMDIVQK